MAKAEALPAEAEPTVKTEAEAEEVLEKAQRPSGAASATAWAWEDDGAGAPAPTVRRCARPGCCTTEPVAGDGGRKFAACARCGARFCGRDCQVADWKKGGCHKRMCPQIAALRDGGFSRDQRRDAVLRGCLGRVRMYAFPHFVCHRALRGAGAVLLHSKTPLEDFFFDGPVNRRGDRMDRSLVVAFVPADDFANEGLGLPREARDALAASAAACGDDRATVLCKFGCGAACVFATDIVPALPVCNALAKDYEDQPVLQLNVDG